jgi:Ca-activated chloride channel homolog
MRNLLTDTSAKWPCRLHSRRGGMLVFCLFLVAVMVAMAAFVINLAHIQMVRTELQTATDASARAANRIFTTTGDLNAALETAQNVANLNPVNGDPLVLEIGDFTPGVAVRSSVSERYSFTPSGGNEANALQLVVSKSPSSSSGPVRLPFPNVLGNQFVSLSANAVVNQLELDIMLVVDRSGSMAYAADEVADYPDLPAAAPPGWGFGMPVPSPSRWLDTEQAVFVFLQAMLDSPQNERVGLVTYASNPALDVDLTTNYQSIVDTLTAYGNSFQLGATNIGDGVASARNNLANSTQSRPWASKVIVVMTDGKHNTGSDPVGQSTIAAENGILVFSVTFSTEADQSRMQSVATTGGGKHFHANSAADLQNVFREIAKMMPSLISR